MKRIFMMLVLCGALLATTGYALSDCSFSTVGDVMYLDGDCTTDETILIPDGMTLDGQGYTITAEDPAAGHFTGAVVQNGGTTAHVVNLGVTTDELTNVCDSGANRLRGIMFEGASGSIRDSNVVGINQGPSGCQEGNAIEVRNEPFDGSHPDTQEVLVKDNYLDAWQKTGIVCNGDVDCTIENNYVGPSESQHSGLAPNGVQVGFGAAGTVERNNIAGGSWCGPSAFVGTAVLMYLNADDSTVSQNNIRGDSDIGIYLFGGSTTVWNNKVFEDKNALDCNSIPYDTGIGNYGEDNVVENNKVKGFDTSYEGVEGGNNKVSPGPNGPNSGNAFW